MTALTETVPRPMRSPWSFMGSICLHAWVLAWVALVPAIPPPAKSLYDREIQPFEKHIVWYKLSEKLPDVTPPRAKRDARPLRARVKFEQSMVAGPHDTARPPQLIVAPAPEIAPAKALPLPNIVAIAPPAHPPARPFLAPPVKEAAATTAPTLPDAPKIATASAEVKAPELDLKTPHAIRAFTPPKQPKLSLPAAPSALPAAPDVVSAAPDLTGTVDLPRQQHKFVAPERKSAAPAESASLAAPPPLLTASAALPAESTLVIAGLDPAKSLEVPPPPGSMNAGFSGGPKVTPRGGEGSPSGSLLEIPSLTVQGGARVPQPPVMMTRLSPTSPESLAAAARSAHITTLAAGAADATPHAVRVSSEPDPRMHGRQVYTMAVQIPNLTSYSGSWLVWFAAREPDIGNPNVDMHPPLPIHMVSPMYVHSAEEDRVQGKVRLWAVIAKDGHVGDISLLQPLDARLDRTAEEALAKWLFQPAVRNGVTVEVDAVFEIPFTLAPKPGR